MRNLLSGYKMVIDVDAKTKKSIVVCCLMTVLLVAGIDHLYCEGSNLQCKDVLLYFFD